MYLLLVFISYVGNKFSLLVHLVQMKHPFFPPHLFCISPNSGPKGQITSTILSSWPWPRTQKRDPQLRNYCRWAVEATHLRFCKRNRIAILCLFCLFACVPAPFCVPAPQQNSGHRAAGQSQQPRPQHLQRLWWRRSWTRGKLWPSKKITLPNIEAIVFLLDFIFFPWNHTLLSFH